MSARQRSNNYLELSKENVSGNMILSHWPCFTWKFLMIWFHKILKLKDDITLLPLTPQAAIFGFFEADYQSYLIQNYILLTAKLYIYKSRKNKFLSSTCLLKEISKIKNIEKKIASVNEKKKRCIKKKVGKNWRQTTIKWW